MIQFQFIFQCQFIISQVLWELTEGKLGEAPLPPTTAAAAKEDIRQPSPELEDEAEDLTEMQSRFEALRS